MVTNKQALAAHENTEKERSTFMDDVVVEMKKKEKQKNVCQRTTKHANDAHSSDDYELVWAIWIGLYALRYMYNAIRAILVCACLKAFLSRCVHVRIACGWWVTKLPRPSKEWDFCFFFSLTAAFAKKYFHFIRRISSDESGFWFYFLSSCSICCFAKNETNFIFPSSHSIPSS